MSRNKEADEGHTLCSMDEEADAVGRFLTTLKDAALHIISLMLGRSQKLKLQPKDI